MSEVTLSRSCEMDATVVRGTEAAEECIKQAVRGLASTVDTVPFVDTDVARCSFCTDDLNMQDSELAEIVRDSEIANWCRTANYIVPVRVNGKSLIIIQTDCNYGDQI